MRELWFGRFNLEEDSCGFWQAGPYQLWAQRSAFEWKIASTRVLEPQPESDCSVEVPSARTEPMHGAAEKRFGFRSSPNSIVLNPSLADRPVVVSPQEPLFVPPDELVAVFISTPVWIEVSLGEASPAVLDEPTQRPTDTWFGPSPMSGELCYATRTAARLNLENVTVKAHRAISIVEIKNRSQSILSVEKIKIPMMHQSLYATDTGALWTETVTLDHHEENELAAVRLSKGPPKPAIGARRIRGPRTPATTGLLTRAFGGLVRWEG